MQMYSVRRNEQPQMAFLGKVTNNNETLTERQD